MDKVKAILNNFKKNQIDVQLNSDGENLAVYFDEETLNPVFYKALKDNKKAIIEYLKTAQDRVQKYKPIPSVSAQPSYPLSSAQHRLWILSQFSDANLAYNIAGMFEIDGALDLPLFEQALSALVERHESLRTIFKENENGRESQVIVPVEQSNFKLFQEDFCLESNKTERLYAVAKQEIETPFDLTKDSLIRAKIIRFSDDKWFFSFVMHHIISDGWSMNILLQELFMLYNSDLKKQEEVLPALAIQYKDYATWQHQQLKSNYFKNHKVYWLDQFSGRLPVLELPGEYPRPIIKTYNGGMIRKHISQAVASKLNNYAQVKGGTLFMGLLSILKVLLYRYTGQTDLIVGSVVAGRNHPDLTNQVGYYVNTIALRSTIEDNCSFSQMMDEVINTTMEAYKHQEYPFDQLVEDLALQRDLSRSPLFDVMLVVQNMNDPSMRMDEKNFGGNRIKPFDTGENTTCKFDLIFTFEEVSDGLVLKLEYNRDIYTQNFVGRMADHLELLMTNAVVSDQAKLSIINYLPDAENKTLLTQLDYTAINYPKHKTILEVFEAQVAESPDHIAVVHDSKHISYQALNAIANQYASYILKRYSIAPNDIIGILESRSEWMIVSILAILKTGAAYLPIDPDYPQDRIDFMVSDSKSKLVLDEAFRLDFEKERHYYESTNIGRKNQAGDLAYIIYTSGSSGQPKGVMIEHENVIRLLQNEKNLFDFNDKDVWTLFHSYCFDFSVWEMYGALFFGAKLVIVPRKVAQDTSAFLELLHEQKVTVLNQTPSYFYNLVKAVNPQDKVDLSLRYLIFGGEALDPAKLKSWRAQYPKVKLINMYGITETTVHVTYKEIAEPEIESGRSNIGVPIPTLSCYVFDANLQLVPQGIVGELYVGGAGVARAYLNRPDLTRQRFIEHPYKKGERLYYSGDVVRQLENGELQYLGRSDQQVKIRGHRIELSEVEQALQKHTNVERCVVLVRKDLNDNNDLVAFLVCDEALRLTSLRAHLAELLPSYMIPGSFLQIDNIPLTSNGKTDRKALLELNEPNISTGQEYVAPRNSTERMLVNIWKQVLRNKVFGIFDGFFVLGGDSIKALRVVNLIKQQFSFHVPLVELYRHTTIASLSDFIRNNKAELREADQKIVEERKTIDREIEQLKTKIFQTFDPIVAVNIEDIYPMSTIEKGMVFETLKKPDEKIYHEQFSYQNHFKDFQVDVFQKALTLMVEKHSIFRTTFDLFNYETEIQIVWKAIPVRVQLEMLSDTSKKKAIIAAYFEHEREKPFDFIAGPLWRMTCFDCGDDTYIFAWQFHHAILDGWSNASFITELNNTYLKLIEQSNYQPAKLNASCKDLIIEQILEKRNQQSVEYWKKELENHTRLEVLSKEDNVDKSVQLLEASSVTLLAEVAKRLNVSEKVICLGVYLYLLKILNNSQDVLIGLVTNARPGIEDGDKVLGCFLNTIPLKVKIDDRLNGRDYFHYINDKLLEIKDFERLSTFEIARVHEEYNGIQNPFFDVIFNYIDFHTFNDLTVEKQEEKEEKSVALDSYEATNTFFDFNINRTNGAFIIALLASKKLKANLSLEKFSINIYKLLKEFLAKPESALQDLLFFTDEERKRLVSGLNENNVSYSTEKTVVELFEEQVEITPQKIAVSFREKR